jgi:hypothetical protein
MSEHICEKIAEIATLQTEMINMKEQMSDLKDIKNSLTVLTTLQQESAKREEETNIERKKQTETLIVLSRMPEVVEKLDKKLDLQNEKLDSQNEKLQNHDEKFIDIDNKLANQAIDKTNKTEITKGKLVLYGVIITAICSGLATVLVSIFSK